MLVLVPNNYYKTLCTWSNNSTSLHVCICFIFDSECMFFTTSKILLVIILCTSKIKANQNFN